MPYQSFDATLDVPAGCPSPDELPLACIAIRQGWSAAEHYRRAGQPSPAHLDRMDAEHWTPPVLAVGVGVSVPWD